MKRYSKGYVKKDILVGELDIICSIRFMLDEFICSIHMQEQIY